MKSQEQTCLNLKSALKKSVDELRATKNELAGVDTKFKTAAQDVARMSHEIKATEKTLEEAKGHGDNAASRIFDLERKLLLRIDELKAFREERLMQNLRRVISEGNLR